MGHWEEAEEQGAEGKELIFYSPSHLPTPYTTTFSKLNLERFTCSGIATG